MSSFDDFYKKWKEENKITTEKQFQNYSEEQRNKINADIAENTYKNSLMQIQNHFDNMPKTQVDLRPIENNYESIWDKVVNVANDIGKIGENAWLGAMSGIQNFNQTLLRRTQETSNNRFKTPDVMQKYLTEEEKRKENEMLNKTNQSFENMINNSQLKKQNFQEKMAQNTENIDNKIGKKLSEIAPSIGQMTPGMIPGVGTAYFTGSATGAYYDEAKQRGMSDDEADVFSGLMGLAEGASEMIGIENLKKAGKATRAFLTGTKSQAIKGIEKSTIRTALKEYGIGIADNAIQEALIDPIQEITAGVVADKAQWEGIGEKMINDAIDGGLVSAILGGANMGVQSCTALVDNYKKGNKPTHEEFKKAVQDVSKELDVPQMIFDQASIKIDNINAQNNQQQITPPMQENAVEMQPDVNYVQENANSLNNAIENDKYLPQDAKIDYINTINELVQNNELNEKTFTDIAEQVKQLSRDYQSQVEGLDTGKKYLTGRKEIYGKYARQENYDNSVVNQAKELVRPNNQGRRTKEQWLQVAKQIGTNIADKPNSQIQEIAYKSWQEERPNSTGTLNRQGKKYVKFDSDEWIDTIYNEVEAQRQKTGYVAENQTATELDNLAQNYKIPVQNVQNQVQKVDTSNMNLIDSAKQYNLDAENESIKSIDNVLKKRGMKARFDESLFLDENGKNKTEVNAVWVSNKDSNGNVTREVVFNPKADTNKTIETVGMHELVHDLSGTEEFKELSKLVLDKNKTREGYDNARANLEDIYSQVYDRNKADFKTLVDEEELADTLGQKLTDQEFINGLSKEKPTVFKKVYNWVVEKLNNLTGGKVEKLYWENIKNKFENAYRQDYKAKDNSKYSVTMKEIADLIESRNLYEQRADKLQKAGDENWVYMQNKAMELNDKIEELKKQMIEENKSYSVSESQKDNKGRTLSKEQQEYFKDSKLRDANGNLLEVYHGTPTGGFYEFNSNLINSRDSGFLGDGFYFTEDLEDAESYMQDYETGEETDNSEVKKVYLDLKNPYIVPSNVEYGGNMLANILGVDNRNVKNKLIKEGYDGVIYQNPLHNEIVAFNPEQIKNVDNTNPTSNPDIRYSTSEENNDKNLLAIHNISADKLNSTLDLGGFPVPSIAITNPDITNHKNFGEISIVFNKDTIDPSNKQNEVYDRDVWSPTFPEVKEKLNSSKVKELAKSLKKSESFVENAFEDISKEQALRRLTHEDTLLDDYVEKNNLEYNEEYKDAKLKRSYNENEEMKQFVKENDITFDKLVKDKNLQEQYLQLIKDSYKDNPLKGMVQRKIENIKSMIEGNNETARIDLDEDFNSIKTGLSKEIDAVKTRENKLNVALKNGYYNYIKDTINDLYGEKYVRNNKDYFSKGGVPRKFDQLYDEYNLENITNILTSQKTISNQKGFGAGKNFGTLQANLNNRFKSIDEIKKNKNKLKGGDELSNELTNANKLFDEDLDTLSQYYKGDPIFSAESAGEALNEFTKSKKLSKENLKNQLTDSRFDNVPDDVLNKILEHIETIRNIPTDYFEAKPQRAVGIDEVQAVVVPKDIDAKLRARLEEKGLNIVEYDPNVEGDRQAKLKELNDYKFSVGNKGKWNEFLNTQIGKQKGNKVKDLRLPTNNNVNAYNVLYQDNKKELQNIPVAEGGKVRKTYTSIISSVNQSPEAKAIAKELIGNDTYIPDSNKNQLQRADNRIERNGINKESETLAVKVQNGDKITAEDIATGERLIEYYSKTGEKEKLQDTIQNVALAGTQLGQAVQAMSLISKQTPVGQAVYIEKVINKMNSNIDKQTKGKGQKFDFTPEMKDKILNSNKENLESNIDEVAQELGQQVSRRTIEKIDAWRYFSMLANPRTHIRNIIGNLAMGKLQGVKNKVAGGIEAVVQKTGLIDERTKSIIPASKEVKEFAKNDVDNVMDRLNNESKFDTKNLIQQYQRTFKSDILEKTLGKAFDFNSKALELEDVIGLKSAYKKALSDYMTANKLKPSDLTQDTKESKTKLENARKYAVQQAQEATFHQASSLASWLSQFESKNKFTRLMTGAILPFKKTPINVAKTGVDYSPIGLTKAFTTDLSKLKKGEITATQYIDNISKGLTGTGVAVLGYALANSGILSASRTDDDDKKNKFESDRGKQPFALTIGNKTYSLDWLAPSAIPLFLGAEINQNIKSQGKEQTQADVLERLGNSLDAMTKSLNPMVEMSMLSGLAGALKSFAQDETQFFSNLAINSTKSYVNQFFPTIGGQLARTIDDTERSTTSTKKNALAKAVDSTGKQIIAKIPFASKNLPTRTDVWGNTQKQDSNVGKRAMQQFIFPWREKTLKSTSVDNAISDLYEQTGEKSVLPNVYINKDFNINGNKYRMTSEQYAKYKKDYGKTSYNLLEKLTSSEDYKEMTDEQKTKSISEIYSYASENNKINYADKKGIDDVKKSTTYKAVQEIKEQGGKESDYFKYIGKITGVEDTKDKLNVLENLDVSSKSKSAIYSTTIGSKDTIYNIIDDIDIDQYLEYKQQNFASDRIDDGTTKGKTVTNSKKRKTYDYVNDMKITRNQKLVLLGSQYKLFNDEQEELYDYISNLPATEEEIFDIFKDFSSNFTTYKDGTIDFK